LRSQLQSRRLSQLLVALQDVIGTDEEDVTEHIDEPSMLADDSGSSSPRSSEEPWTIVHEPSDVEHDTPIARTHSELEDDDDDQNTVRLASSPRRRSVIFSSSSSSSLQPTSDVHSDHSLENESDILSPMSNLPFVPFLEDKYPDTIDSGYADNWTSPFPLRLSPPRSPSVSSVYGFFTPTSGVFPQQLSAFISAPTPDPLLSNQETGRESVKEVTQLSHFVGETTHNPDEIGVAVEWPNPDHLLASEPTSCKPEETLVVHPPAASTPPDAEAIAEYYVDENGSSGCESIKPPHYPYVNSPKGVLEHTPSDDDGFPRVPVDDHIGTGATAETPSLVASNWSPSENSTLLYADSSEAEVETENDSLQSLYDVYSGFSSPYSGTDLGPCSPDAETGSILSDNSGSPSSAFTPLPRRGGRSTAIVEVIPSPCFSHSSGQSSTQSLLDDSEEQGDKFSTKVSYKSQQFLKGHRSESSRIKSPLGSTPHTLKDKNSLALLQPRLPIDKPLYRLRHTSSNEFSAPSRTSRLKPLRLVSIHTLITSCFKNTMNVSPVYCFWTRLPHIFISGI
jgi:hypothetical protein